jgi:hypothetical protein
MPNASGDQETLGFSHLHDFGGYFNRGDEAVPEKNCKVELTLNLGE